jgi:YidC/Oxa1 family membrane protein insertase
MEKRTLVALLLSFVVILSYPYILKIFYPSWNPDEAAPPPAADTRETPPAEEWAAPSAAAVSDASRELDTRLYNLRVSESYGSIVSLGFTEFKGSPQSPLRFIEARDGFRGIGSVEILEEAAAAPPVFRTEVTPEAVLSRADAGGLDVTKEIRFSNSSYGNELRIKIENKSDRPRTFRLRLAAGSGLTQETPIDRQYFEANWIGATSVEHVRSPGKGKTKASGVPVAAASLKDRHFSSILKPEDPPRYQAAIEGLDGDFAVWLVGNPVTLGPGASWHEKLLLYIGPNRGDDLRPYGLEHVVTFGKLDAICKLLLGGMQLTYGVVRNHGVAIILLTLLLNVLLFPLTRASLLSMKRMQLVQPQMAKIREKFKDDSTRMNKEMMELYRKYKVNPMGGCLPMFLQMPVFIALYVALSKSLDLVGSKLLWIQDLASPDAVPLPFSLPFVGNSVHILPLVMVAAMIAQQKISQRHAPPPADPNLAQQQKIMSTVMPIFFGFLFYPMPSGLVLYWITNTVFMTAVNLLILRQDVHL